VPFALQLLLFASPVIYAPTLIPKPWRWLLDVNPLTGLIQSFRFALIGKPALDGPAFASAIGLTTLICTTGLWYFRRREPTFADIV